MAEKPFEQICNLFFEVAQFPLLVCQRDGTPLYWLPGSETPDSAEVNRALVDEFEQATPQPPIPFVEITDPIFFLGVIKLRDDNYLLLGPVAPIRHDDRALWRFAETRNIPGEQRNAYCEGLNRASVFSFRNFLTTVSLVNYTFTQSFISPDAILLLRPNLLQSTDAALTRTLFDARENQVVHTPASYEHHVLQAVSDGNITKLKQALLSPVSGKVGKMSSDPIRQEKYTFISFVTLVTRAAIAGGLNPELAFSLSDIYCQTVDRSQDILEISKLAFEMCLDFTEKVAAAQGKARLSPAISACCEYISAHLHDDIDMEHLAAQVRLGTKSLSKKFKTETGLPITDYIHRERIKEARSLLEHSDYSVSEIGYFLKYGSQSYFSSIFKKFNGVTPQQFREQVKKARLY
jgi:AraC-like DNA-binding protein